MLFWLIPWKWCTIQFSSSPCNPLHFFHTFKAVIKSTWLIYVERWFRQVKLIASHKIPNHEKQSRWFHSVISMQQTNNPINQLLIPKTIQSTSGPSSCFCSFRSNPNVWSPMLMGHGNCRINNDKNKYTLDVDLYDYCLEWGMGEWDDGCWPIVIIIGSFHHSLLPLVNYHISMENCHLKWGNSLFRWPFSQFANWWTVTVIPRWSAPGLVDVSFPQGCAPPVISWFINHSRASIDTSWYIYHKPQLLELYTNLATW